MRKMRRTIIFALILGTLLLAAGCAGKRKEIGGYLNGTLEYFKKNTGEKITYNDKEGYYTNKSDTLEVTLKDNVIWKIELRNEDKTYQLYGVRVGQRVKDARSAIKDTFPSKAEASKGAQEKETMESYQSGNLMLTLGYDSKQKITMVSLELTGYSVGNTSSESSSGNRLSKGDVIAKVGAIEVTYSEAMIYLLTAQQGYEKEFGNEVWSYDIEGNGTTIGQVLKAKVLDQIVQLEIICCQANKLGISLNDDEMLQVKDDAANFMKTVTKEQQDKYGITEELAVQVFASNALAEKVYETTTIDVDTNVDDEDAKQITVDIIHLRSYGEDSKGNRTELTKSETKELQDKVKEIYKTAKTIEDFDAYAQKVSDEEKTHYTIGHGELEDSLDKAAFQLKSGQLSQILQNEDGYYLIYCEQDYDEDATLQQKEKIIEQRRSDLFLELYTKWSQDYSVRVNSTLWSQVDLSPLEDDNK